MGTSKWSCYQPVWPDVDLTFISAHPTNIYIALGGNDAELSNILNQCIYQWAVLNPTQVLVAKAAALANLEYGWMADIDWDALARGCDGQLEHTNRLINGDAFSQSLDNVIAAAKKKLGSKWVPAIP